MGAHTGPDGEPVAEVVEHHPLMSGRMNAEFHPDLVGPEDLVMRKTGFAAVAAGNLLELLTENGWDTVVMGGLTTVSPSPSTGSRPRTRMRSRSPASATSSGRR